MELFDFENVQSSQYGRFGAWRAHAYVCAVLASVYD